MAELAKRPAKMVSAFKREADALRKRDELELADRLAESGVVPTPAKLKQRTLTKSTPAPSALGKRRRVTDPSDKLEGWTCAYRRHRDEVCAHRNSSTDLVCTACGAFRWDGAQGQLRAQLFTILRTCDLECTSKKQVMRRLRQRTQYAFPTSAINSALTEFLHAAGQEHTSAEGMSAVPARATPPISSIPDLKGRLAGAQVSLWNCIYMLAAEQRLLPDPSSESHLSDEAACSSAGTDDQTLQTVFAVTNFAGLLTGGLLRRRWNFLQSRGEFVAQLWPGLMPPPALVVEEMGTERSGEHGSDVCGRGSEGTAAPVAVSRPLPTQTLRKLVRQHCGLGKERPPDVSETTWPLLDPCADYERTMWVAAAPFSIRKRKGEGASEDDEESVPRKSAFAPVAGGQARPIACPAPPASPAGTWEVQYPGVTNPGGPLSGDIAAWKTAVSGTTLGRDVGRSLAAASKIRDPYLPRLAWLEGLDPAVAHVFETAAGLGLRAEVIEAAIRRYMALCSA